MTPAMIRVDVLAEHNCDLLTVRLPDGSVMLLPKAAVRAGAMAELLALADAAMAAFPEPARASWPTNTPSFLLHRAVDAYRVSLAPATEPTR